MEVPENWIDRAGQRRSMDKLILDLDNSVSQICGRQEGSAERPPSQALMEGSGIAVRWSTLLSGK